MNILEKELEDLIFQTIESGNSDRLVKRGLYQVSRYNIYSRQLDLGDYGRLDMVGFHFNGKPRDVIENRVLNVGIFELKKGEINFETLKQALKYAKGIEKFINDTPKYNALNLCCDFTFNLIGTSVCKGDFIYLADYMENLNIYTTKIDLEKGISFSREYGYSIVDGNTGKGKPSLEKMMKDYFLRQMKINKGLIEDYCDNLPF